jgi:hypothetical protein
MPDVGFDFEPPKKDDGKGWNEAETKIKNTLDYAIRNSNVVNVQSRKNLMMFVREYDQSKTTTEAASSNKEHKLGNGRRKRK